MYKINYIFFCDYCFHPIHHVSDFEIVSLRIEIKSSLSIVKYTLKYIYLFFCNNINVYRSYTFIDFTMNLPSFNQEF